MNNEKREVVFQRARRTIRQGGQVALWKGWKKRSLGISKKELLSGAYKADRWQKQEKWQRCQILSDLV